jgi:hypothetical protein
MGRNNYFSPGQWSIHCQECWTPYKTSQIRKRWDGFWVCNRCWEPRHPQDFIRAIPDRQNVPFSTSDPDFIYPGTAGDLFIVPSTATFSQTIDNNITTVTVDDGGFAPTTVNITLTMPTTPYNNQYLNVFPAMYMNQLTINANAGQSITRSSFPKWGAAQSIQFKYTTAGTVWTWLG